MAAHSFVVNSLMLLLANKLTLYLLPRIGNCVSVERVFRLGERHVLELLGLLQDFLVVKLFRVILVITDFLQVLIDRLTVRGEIVLLIILVLHNLRMSRRIYLRICLRLSVGRRLVNLILLLELHVRSGSKIRVDAHSVLEVYLFLSHSLSPLVYKILNHFFSGFLKC